MKTLLRPWHLLLFAPVGWASRQQQDVIDSQNTRIVDLVLRFATHVMRHRDTKFVPLRTYLTGHTDTEIV
jgi:hypothetical protein